MKPEDLKSIKFRIVQLQNFMDKVQKLRNAVVQDDVSAFTKGSKHKSGQECAHKFNEKCTCFTNPQNKNTGKLLNK